VVLKDEIHSVLRTFTNARSNNYTGENGSIWIENWSQLVIIFHQSPFLKDPKALYEKQWLKPCCTPLKKPCLGATWQTPTPSLPGDHARQVKKRTGLSFIVFLPHKRVPCWGLSSSLKENLVRQEGVSEKFLTPWSLILYPPPKMYLLSPAEQLKLSSGLQCI
jgi:hypothetical protein